MPLEPLNTHDQNKFKLICKKVQNLNDFLFLDLRLCRQSAGTGVARGTIIIIIIIVFITIIIINHHHHCCYCPHCHHHHNQWLLTTLLTLIMLQVQF